MSTYAPAPETQPTVTVTRPERQRSSPGRATVGRESALALATAILTAAVICFATFAGEGGLKPGQATTVEIVLTLLAGVAIAAAILLAPPRRRISGSWPVALLLAFTLLTAASISWSVVPNTSWQEASMMFAYSAVFVAAAALARAAPGRGEAVLGGVALAAVIVCGYALLGKVFPGHVGAIDTYARLVGPFGYWNATGLAAGMGLIACMWLGGRRTAHALLRALAYPAAGLLIVTLMLAYSRGALAATAIGVALWLCVVPLRLRGAAVLIAAGACAAGVVAFAFAKASLSEEITKVSLSAEKVALSNRANGGHELGVLLLAMVLLLLAIGVAVGFLTSRRAPSRIARRRAGAALIAALVLAVLAVLGGLAASQRGLTGTISHDVSSLTNPDAPLPVLANTPNRLTAVASVRARYWKEAIEVFEAHPALGAGAGGYAVASLRYKPPELEVRNAHGYVVQTLADLGIVGVALTLLLLIAWAVAAGAATHPFNRRWRKWRWTSAPQPYTPERLALLSMLCIVVTFGLHSFVDWTWYVPGTAAIALLCAGWLVGRGPLHEPALEPDAGRWRHLLPGQISGTRLAAALAAILVVLLAAWVQWQPQLSYEESQNALALTATSPHRALAEAQGAVSRDPFSAEALSILAIAQEQLGRADAATATLQRAVHMQPANPETWEKLGRHDLTSRPRAAVSELGAALYLSPHNAGQPSYQEEYVEALRGVAALKQAKAARKQAHR